ncbi:MAG: hypothetical protein KDH96_12895, partial [Candidatus Riesia sp.]|nr:hypothetical protein [Candidatus Riesia sp.]
NPLLRELKSLGLGIKGKNTKFIPEIYKTASIQDRIALLQGLLDTDGYVNAQGNDIHFTNVNKQLIDDFTEISRSLGLKVTVSTKENQNGLFYRARISGNIPFNIFRLDRKLERFKLRKSKNTFDMCAITSITKLDEKAISHCIVVSNPNHLYITNDYIVTHNSYYHAAKLVNQFWFEQGARLKMGASLKKYVNSKGTWQYLQEYANHLNAHTAWVRPIKGSAGAWEQKIEVKKEGRLIEVGLKSLIEFTSFEKDATAGVGGPCYSPDTQILMSNYKYKSIKDIKLGDKIIGADGKFKKVTKLFEGQDTMYQITQSLGITYNVTSNHMLYLYDTRKKDFVKIAASEFNNLSNYRREKFLKGIKYSGYLGENKELFIDPYYLGAYLGNGCSYD